MLSDATLATLVPASAARFGRKTAIICDGMTVSFGELDLRVGRLAHGLAARGIGAGAVVSIFGPVGLEWVVAYHAALRIGAVVNPINALLTPDEIGFIISDCSARMIIADQGRIERLAAVIPASTATLSFEAIASIVADGPATSTAADVSARDISTICYTSGTTGRPKGAVLTHRNVLLNAGLTALMHGRSSDDVVVSALPLAHVYGNVVMNSALISGATLVLIPAFSPEAVFAAIAAHRATRFDGVPTMFYFMLESPALTDADLSSLRCCHVGGQTMPIERMRAVETRFGCPLLELWGMSEIGGLGTTFPATGPRKLGSIGIPLPTMQVRTVDRATQAPTATGVPGELQIKGPLVMQGYLGDPSATAEVLSDDGWLSTGDIALIDDDGHIFIVDRAKDMILVSGNNVYPAEIERVIAMLDSVAMVGVGRDMHPVKGEAPHAYVVVKAGHPCDDQALISHCREHLAPYKIPRAVSFVADLPRTASGKIMRRKLGAE